MTGPGGTSPTRPVVVGAYDRGMSELIACDFCGRAAPEGEVPVTWTSSWEQGRLRRFCERCSREHLRSIEGKLDSDWW